MTSKSISQKAFLKPDLSLEQSSREYRKSRKPTVYDAVAGRISTTGFIPKSLFIPSSRDTPSSSTTAISPETVLFRYKHAPPRYAESDIYFATERESITTLPESDVLKALHCYISDFYSRTASDKGVGVWCSLDETALLCFGILLEETVREILGETGDLVFTEGEADNDYHKNVQETLRSRNQGLTSRLSASSRERRASKRRRKG